MAVRRHHPIIQLVTFLHAHCKRSGRFIITALEWYTMHSTAIPHFLTKRWLCMHKFGWDGGLNSWPLKSALIHKGAELGKMKSVPILGLKLHPAHWTKRLFLESYSLREILMYFKIIVRIFVSTFCLSQTDAIIFQCRAAPNADQALEICEALVEQHDHPLLITNDSRHSGKQGISS